MEVKKMKAGVEYATCDGRLVVPIAPVHANWASVRNPKSGTYTVQALNGVTSGDPWANCHPAGAGAASRPYAEARGVRVKVYAVNRDGSAHGAGTETVLPPRDVKGLWADYLVLYAHVIEKRADDREEERRRKEKADSTAERLAALGLKGHLWVRWRYADKGEKTAFYGLELTAPDAATLETIMHRLETGAPATGNVRSAAPRSTAAAGETKRRKDAGA